KALEEPRAGEGNSQNLPLSVSFTNRMKLFKILLFTLVIAAGCSKPSIPSSKPLVLSTLAPYSYFVKRLAEDGVRAETLVPAGANAHLFEPTPKEISRLQEARLWIRMGDPFETKLLPSLEEKRGRLEIVKTWKGLPLIREEGSSCSGWDRHLWLSPKMVREFLPGLAAALIRLCPEREGEIKERLKRFLDELQELDMRIASLLKGKAGAALLASHPSFGYFCRDYGLTQLSLEFEGKEPLPKQLGELFAKIKEKKIKKIFTQPQFPTRGAERLAGELSLTLCPVDPYAYDYLGNLEAFATALASE
ncbi:MAG: hypothetical protein A3D18_00445, partial [Chlamydiae bacterium RIFCSPHIGHO2_02_FULL_49_29]